MIETRKPVKTQNWANLLGRKMTLFCPPHDNISSFFRISRSAIWTTHRWHESKYISTRILMKCNVWEACTALKQKSRSHMKLGWNRKRETPLKKANFLQRRQRRKRNYHFKIDTHAIVAIRRLHCLDHVLPSLARFVPTKLIEKPMK